MKIRVNRRHAGIYDYCLSYSLFAIQITYVRQSQHATKLSPISCIKYHFLIVPTARSKTIEFYLGCCRTTTSADSSDDYEYMI